MIRLYFIYIILVLISSCCSEKKDRPESVIQLLNVTPKNYDLPMHSIPTGINLVFGELSFDFPIRDTLKRLTQTDTALSLKYGDTLKFILVKEDYNWALELLRKQSQSNKEIKELLEERKFKSDLDLLGYLYNSRPTDENPYTEVVMDIKELLIPSEAKKGIYKINNNIIKGYQYCIDNTCRTISSDLYINGNSYKVISMGLSQEEFHKILGSVRIKSTQQPK